MKALSRKKLAQIPPAVWIIFILVIFFGSQVDGFFSGSNLRTFLITAAPLLVLAFGQTLVIMTQGTDLSVGSIISTVSVLWVLLMKMGMPAAAAMVLSVLAGGVAGLFNGILVAKLKIPAFIATLGTQNIFASVALVLSNNTTIHISKNIFSNITYGNFLFIPICVWIAIICFCISLLILKRTRFGMKIVALGGNSEALNLAGVNVASKMILAFVFAGIMAGISGILMACRIESGNPLAGEGWEFNSIAAVLLGGTSMRDGNGTVVGTIFGVFFIQIVKTGLNQIGLESIYQNALIGGTVLSAIIVDACIKRVRD